MNFAEFFKFGVSVQVQRLKYMDKCLIFWGEIIDAKKDLQMAPPESVQYVPGESGLTQKYAFI